MYGMGVCKAYVRGGLDDSIRRDRSRFARTSKTARGGDSVRRKVGLRLGGRSRAGGVRWAEKQGSGGICGSGSGKKKEGMDRAGLNKSCSEMDWTGKTGRASEPGWRGRESMSERRGSGWVGDWDKIGRTGVACHAEEIVRRSFCRLGSYLA